MQVDRPEPDEEQRLPGISGWLRRRGPVARAAGAFLLYAVVSGVLLVRDVFLHLSTRCIGLCRSDTWVYLWSYRWMPYALSHGLNPLFVTNYIWAPKGVNLVWVTTLPGPAFVMAPITLLFGALVTNNILLWLAPALAGWAAYLLCAQVTQRYWPSVAGGFVFGFSTYVGHHVRGQVNLMLMFCVPLAVYLVVRRVRGRIGPVAFALLLFLTLIAQFTTSSEIFATMTMFGGIAMVGAFALGPRDLRPALWRTGLLVGGVYLAVGVVVLPYLLEVVAHRPPGAIRPLDRNSMDLLSYVLPRTPTWIGTSWFFDYTQRHFRSLGVDDTAYLGPAFLLMLVVFAWTTWRSRATWLLLAFLAVPVVFSFGPVLHVGGRPTITMPGSLLAKTPVISSALPERFPLYVWLVVSVITALFLSASRGRWAWTRWAVVAVALVLIAVDLPRPPYRTTMHTPTFFTDGMYRRHLKEGETVLILTNDIGDEMLWQQAANFYFKQTRGYIGLAHPRRIGDPGAAIAHQGGGGGAVSTPGADEFQQYLHEQQVGAVILPTPAPEEWTALLRSFGARPIQVGGITLYEEPPGGWVPAPSVAPIGIGAVPYCRLIRRGDLRRFVASVRRGNESVPQIEFDTIRFAAKVRSSTGRDRADIQRLANLLSQLTLAIDQAQSSYPHDAAVKLRLKTLHSVSLSAALGSGCA